MNTDTGNMDNGKQYIAYGINTIMAVVISGLITTGLILGLAGLMLSGKVSPGAEKICLTIIRILSCLAGGFLIGKKNRRFGFLWGLMIGLIYYGLLVLIGVLSGGGAEAGPVSQISVLVICALSGMLGGMIS